MLTLQEIENLKQSRETDALVAEIVLGHDVRTDSNILWWEGFTTLAFYSCKESNDFVTILKHIHDSNKAIIVTNMWTNGDSDWQAGILGNNGWKVFQSSNLALAVCQAALYVFSGEV